MLLDGKKGNLVETITSLERHAVKEGLDPSEILALLDLILHSSLDELKKKRLVKSLYPKTVVPEKAIVSVLGILGTKKSAAFKLGLLKWIVLVDDYLESKKVLSQLYGVLFHYLAYDPLRPILCQILYQITKRDHVKPFRCRKLVELHRLVGNELPLMGLLSAYKAYAPDSIFITIPNSRSALFKHPDPNWEKNLLRFRKKSSIPPVISENVSVEVLSSLQDLNQNIDRLEFPNQLASILNDRMLQHLLSCHSDKSTIMRLSHWLGQTLVELCFRSDQTLEVKKRISKLLDQVVQFSSFMQEELSVIESFLFGYLKTWDGVDYADQIFKLLSLIRPKCFEDFYGYYLKPLQKIFYSSSLEWKVKLLNSLTCLLQNWATVDWEKHFVSTTIPSRDPNHNLHKEFIFEKPSTKVDHFKTIYELVKLVDMNCILALEVEGDNIFIQHATLSFFETVVEANLKHKLPFVILPSPVIIFRCLLSDTSMATSRICGLFAKYKTAFDMLKKTSNSGSITFNGYKETSFSNGLDLIYPFNAYICDICNLLWRVRNFQNDNGEFIVTFPIPRTMIDELKQDAMFPLTFSLTHSSSFASFSRSFVMASCQKHKKMPPVTVESIKFPAIQDLFNKSFLDIRMSYLDFLKEKGLTGLYDFLYTFIKSLVQRRDD